MLPSGTQSGQAGDYPVVLGHVYRLAFGGLDDIIRYVAVVCRLDDLVESVIDGEYDYQGHASDSYSHGAYRRNDVYHIAVSL